MSETSGLEIPDEVVKEEVGGGKMCVRIPVRNMSSRRYEIRLSIPGRVMRQLGDPVEIPANAEKEIVYEVDGNLQSILLNSVVVKDEQTPSLNLVQIKTKRIAIRPEGWNSSLGRIHDSSRSSPDRRGSRRTPSGLSKKEPSVSPVPSSHPAKTPVQKVSTEPASQSLPEMGQKSDGASNAGIRQREETDREGRKAVIDRDEEQQSTSEIPSSVRERHVSAKRVSELWVEHRTDLVNSYGESCGIVWRLEEIRKIGKDVLKRCADRDVDEGMTQTLKGFKDSTEDLLESWYADLGEFSTDRITRRIGGKKTAEAVARILNEQRIRLREALGGEGSVRVNEAQKESYESYVKDDLLKRLIERIDQGKWEERLKGEMLKGIEAGIAKMLDVVGLEEMEIEEGETDFDARIHKDERSVPGPVGMIVKIHRRGIREKGNGRIVRMASVEVGQE